jgi:uncharacterized protein YcnI
MNKLIPLVAAAAVAISAVATAHVTVWPRESVAGGHEKYQVRVPNEKQVDTVAVEVRIPPGLRVTSFEQKPGWMTEPLRDGSGKLAGVRWRGSLPPQQFTEFGLLAVNPAAAGDLGWSAVQTFADGSKIDWSGAAGSKTPAPHITILPAPR